MAGAPSDDGGKPVLITPPVASSKFRFAIFFGWGIFAAGVAAFVEALALGFHAAITVDLLIVLFAPLIEEFGRTASLVALSDQSGPPRADQYRWPVLAFGLGFTFFEAISHWLLMRQGSNSLVVFVATLSPLAMHLSNTIVTAVFVMAGRQLTGFAICATIHAVHNAWVEFVWRDLPPIAELISSSVQIAIFVAIGLWFWIGWSRLGPEYQFRAQLR